MVAKPRSCVLAGSLVVILSRNHLWTCYSLFAKKRFSRMRKKETFTSLPYFMKHKQTIKLITCLMLLMLANNDYVLFFHQQHDNAWYWICLQVCMILRVPLKNFLCILWLCGFLEKFFKTMHGLFSLLVFFGRWFLNGSCINMEGSHMIKKRSHASK